MLIPKKSVHAFIKLINNINCNFSKHFEWLYFIFICWLMVQNPQLFEVLPSSTLKLNEKASIQ